MTSRSEVMQYFFPPLKDKLTTTVSARFSRDDGCCSPPRDALQQWMERTNAQPFKFLLASDFPDYDCGFRSVDVPIETLKLLRAMVCRAEDLEIRVPTDPGFDQNEGYYTTDDEAELEDLEERERRTRLALKKKSASLPPLLPSDFRHLTHLTWQGHSRRFLRYPLPWAQLKHISLKGRGAVISSQTCLELLKQCTSITGFDAKVISSPIKPPYQGERVDAPQLTHLDVEGAPNAFTSLFLHLDARHLTSLRMAIASPYGPEDNYYKRSTFQEELFPAMNSFLQASQDTLESLSFRGVKISSEQLLLLLRLVSNSLTALEIDGSPCFDGAIVTAMTVSSEAPAEPLCLRLSHLTLEKSLPDDPDLPDGLLAEMVESRCKSYPFSEISILTNPRPYILGDAVRIESLHKRGKLKSFSWWQEGIRSDDDWF
ncbi:hypothetical protein ONZ45_g6824 [Pleurotus djamor]|nr:hypothetical protein ONZ45_g6824 [Pleurotus djamor]